MFTFATGGLALTIMLLLLAGTTGLIAVQLQGKKLMSVQSQSMQPTFQTGDTLIVKPAKSDELHPGDIISYQNPADSRVIISHRLVDIDRQTGMAVTSGDALGSRDKPFPSSLIIGRAEAVLSRFGYVLNGLRHPAGLALFIFLPAAIVIGHEIKRLIYVLSARL